MGIFWQPAPPGLYHRQAVARRRGRHARARARGRAWNRNVPGALVRALTAPLAPLAALYAAPRPRPLPVRLVPCPAGPR